MTGDGAVREMLRRYAILFWDFDGVIKDSVNVKSDAFEGLFASFGRDLALRVRAHHECNGGMPRSEKLPLYLRWTGHEASAADIARYSEEFSRAVRSAVVSCPWVPGAREYLETNFARQRFVLVTATPQAEIEDILYTLGVAHWFAEIHGTPLAKAQAIASVLERVACPVRSALMIGDSESDHEAARAAGIDFLLRRTPFNRPLQRSYGGPQCEDFH